MIGFLETMITQLTNPMSKARSGSFFQSLFIRSAIEFIEQSAKKWKKEIIELDQASLFMRINVLQDMKLMPYGFIIGLTWKKMNEYQYHSVLNS